MQVLSSKALQSNACATQEERLSHDSLVSSSRFKTSVPQSTNLSAHSLIYSKFLTFIVKFPQASIYFLVSDMSFLIYFQ